jgi:hypothetical protein
MARSFKDAIREQRRNRDALQGVDDTVPGFIPDPSTSSQPTPGGRRRARTFSQAIAEATRGVDHDSGRWMPPVPDLASQPYKPDWRGHYGQASKKPVPRALLNLATLPVASQIVPVLKFDSGRPRDQADRIARLREQFRPKAMR